MKYFLNPFFNSYKNQIQDTITNFNSTGILFGDGKRNKIKLFELEDKTLNIKSFKIPNLINKLVYTYFRKSKARRSFEYGSILIEKGIGTPQPIAYFENYDFIGLKDSYYISEHLDCDLTFRELVEIPNYPDHSNILKQFTRFSFKLHEKGIEFLDHSPGNTLIKKTVNGDYDFFLVDLNRMNFHDKMSFKSRMKNLSRLTPYKNMVQLISKEYAVLSNEDEELVFETLWKFTSKFQSKYYRKKNMKKKFKIWS
jgi:hypothetical protein